MENVKKAIAKLEGRLSVEVRKQKKLEIIEEQDFRRENLLRKYIVKMLYRWNDRKFEEKCLKKLERNW